jgi:hypothetical protein
MMTEQQLSEDVMRGNWAAEALAYLGSVNTNATDPKEKAAARLLHKKAKEWIKAGNIAKAIVRQNAEPGWDNCPQCLEDVERFGMLPAQCFLCGKDRRAKTESA